MRLYSSFLLLPIVLFFFNDTATTEIYTLSLHDALPIFLRQGGAFELAAHLAQAVEAECAAIPLRSEEHTSELQSPDHLVCRLLLEKKKRNTRQYVSSPYASPSWCTCEYAYSCCCSDHPL